MPLMPGLPIINGYAVDCVECHVHRSPLPFGRYASGAISSPQRGQETNALAPGLPQRVPSNGSEHPARPVARHHLDWVALEPDKGRGMKRSANLMR
jgi:hypothetical protein